MSSLLVTVLILSLSLHACHARHLITKGSSKDVEKIKFDETSSPVKPVQLVPEEHQSKSRQTLNGEVEASGSIGDAILGKPKEIERTRGTNSGIKNAISSSDVGLRQENKIEMGKPLRSLLGPVSHIGHAAIATGESIDSQETDVTGEELSMDYEKPHRKPPINNKSP